MPTYDYRCKACEHEFELFQSMSDSPKRTCPKCGKRQLERLIGTGAALLFKGSGFYETDYRSDGYKKAKSADSSESKSESSSDSKPDAKTETKPEKQADKKPDGKPKPDKKPKAASK